MKIKTVLIFTTILLIILASVFAIHAGQPVDTGKNQSNKVFTAPQGDPERKAILDTLRKRWPSDMDVIFVVTYLEVKDGWAWIAVRPQSRDGHNQFEDESWLLQKINGQWKEVTARGAGLDCEEDPDCSDDQRFYKKLKIQFPDMPMDILPHEGQGKPIPSHADKNILDYYNMLPAKLLGGYKDAIQIRNNTYTSFSRDGYRLEPVVIPEIGYLQIIDKGTGGGKITQDVSFMETNEGNNIIRVNLIKHDGVGPVCTLRLYTLDGKWTDVTSRYLPEVNISHFLDEKYLARHKQNMNLQPEGVVFVYEFREHDGPMFAHINLERFAMTCPPTPASVELVKNIKYWNVRFLWDKNKNALKIADKGYGGIDQQKVILNIIESRRRR